MRTPGRDFFPSEREAIDRIAAAHGCHVCGTKDPGTLSGRFIPDQQPPIPLNVLLKQPARLYPICLSCSLRQGLWLARWILKQ